MIDWAQVEALREDMGEAFNDIVEVFLAEVSGELAKLDGIAPGKPLASAMHFLKGSALNLGFAEFAALCAEGEMAAQRGEAVDIATIRESYARSHAEFTANL